MVKQMISFLLWTSLVFYSFVDAVTETPKECTVETQEYNESLCREICTEKIHMNESYCANFTKSASPTQPQPQQQQQEEAKTPIAMAEVTLPKDVTWNDFPSSGISIRSSLMFGALSFLLCYFLI